MPGKCSMIVVCAAVSVLPAPVLAHPHAWIDAKVEVILNDTNEATAIRISWVYDNLYSLYVVSDRGLDPDWDGKLTPDEEAKLSGFDMGWDEGFPGDTYALLGEVALPLSRPMDWTATYADDRVTTTHLRSFDAPIPLGDLPLIVQLYDPSYYVAYAIPFDPVVTGGTGCSAQVFVPDLDEAAAEMQAVLAEYTADADLEADFPAIGAAYAEEVRVTCPAP